MLKRHSMSRVKELTLWSPFIWEPGGWKALLRSFSQRKIENCSSVYRRLVTFWRSKMTITVKKEDEFYYSVNLNGDKIVSLPVAFLNSTVNGEIEGIEEIKKAREENIERVLKELPFAFEAAYRGVGIVPVQGGAEIFRRNETAYFNLGLRG